MLVPDFPDEVATSTQRIDSNSDILSMSSLGDIILLYAFMLCFIIISLYVVIVAHI